ncbi:hypothetical protein GCM10025760_34270 [Microbacterium yannicii]|uniref:DUF1772 domain-containing protein n=1 Tax=Microbacterium yannicii TaxID=671622 RepID=A0ABP9MM52_9MICO|nr:hypothetical protein [Microbacterium yannicii]MCO5951892.1 hypothetical protein [Microbacterium yannicii]
MEWAKYVFVAVWAVVALALGSLFAFKPEVPADIYINWMSITRTTHRLQQAMMPRRFILIWYRLGGVAFLVLGVLIPVLMFTGVIGPSAR